MQLLSSQFLQALVGVFDLSRILLRRSDRQILPVGEGCLLPVAKLILRETSKEPNIDDGRANLQHSVIGKG